MTATALQEVSPALAIGGGADISTLSKLCGHSSIFDYERIRDRNGLRPSLRECVAVHLHRVEVCA
jgi:hypothetical protein